MTEPDVPVNWPGGGEAGSEGRGGAVAAPYLVGLDLRGRRVLIAGGGSVAQRRLPRLLAAGADVLLVSPEVTPGVQAMVESSDVEWRQRSYVDGDMEGAWYALAATSDPAVNAEIVAAAEQRRVFCVRADRAVDGTAVTPAIGEYAGLLVGVLAGGEHRRSAAARDRLLAGLRTGTIPAAEQAPAPGVVLVGAGPGDPELITVAGRRHLARADVVVVDRLAPRELLDELGADVVVVDAAKIPYGRSASQDVINAALIEHAKAGKFVVRLKGGDSFLFGRGYEEVLACAAAGVPVTVVPGVTSAFAAPAVAGVPVTHRGVAHEVVVVSGHVDPDSPDCLVDWPAVARLHGTLVLMMAVGRLARFAEVLVAGGKPADTPVAVIAEATTANQRSIRTTVRRMAPDVEANGIRPPAIVVIGPVAAIDPDRPEETDPASGTSGR